MSVTHKIRRRAGTRICEVLPSIIRFGDNPRATVAQKREEIAAFLLISERLTPRGRLAKMREHSARYDGAGGEHLDAAESLMVGGGFPSKGDYSRFKELLGQAWQKIALEHQERELVPLADLGEAQKERSKKGGAASGKQRKRQAEQLHNDIVAAARELLADGKPRHNLAGILSGRYGLSDRQIRIILKKEEI